MQISALNLNDNAMCELGVMFYFDDECAICSQTRSRIRNAWRGPLLRES